MNFTRLTVFLSLFFCSLVMFTSAQSPLPGNVKRILFLGNSITYAGEYITDVEAYLITHYPGLSYEFINQGLPSETVSGLSEEGHAGGRFPRPDLHERLDRVLAITRPDLVFVCYGMNDGIYLPFDETRFQKFREGIVYVHDEIAKSGARIIHLTPPVYDEVKGKKTGYAQTLDKYSDWLISQRKHKGWSVVDIHYPMKKFINAHRKVDAAYHVAAFALAEDGVHPGAAGHWMIAKQILLFLGEKPVASMPDIHSAVSLVTNGPQVLQLVARRQQIMKDAWLTAAGHSRPEMKTGLPLTEAQLKYEEIEKQIRQLMR